MLFYLEMSPVMVKFSLGSTALSGNLELSLACHHLQQMGELTLPLQSAVGPVPSLGNTVELTLLTEVQMR